MCKTMGNFFISIKHVSREHKLWEFHLKFLHGIVVTKNRSVDLVSKTTVNACIVEIR